MNCRCSTAAPAGRGPLAQYLSYWLIVTRSLARHKFQNCNQDEKAKRNSRGHPLRRHGSRRGELPGSGVTSSTPHRAGASAQDPAGTFLPTRPSADEGICKFSAQLCSILSPACLLLQSDKTKQLLCRRGDWLCRFRLGGSFLAFYGHLKRLTQYIVVANCSFSHEHQ